MILFLCMCVYLSTMSNKKLPEACMKFFILFVYYINCTNGVLGMHVIHLAYGKLSHIPCKNASVLHLGHAYVHEMSSVQHTGYPTVLHNIINFDEWFVICQNFTTYHSISICLL